jgi:hypothetical protein
MTGHAEEKEVQKLFGLILLAMSFLCGCIQLTAPPGAIVAVRVPRIESFGSSPPQVDLGRPTQLQWKVNGATSVNISLDIGPVPPSGTMTVAPNHTTVHTITASNSAGVVQHPEEVTVPRKFENTKQQ